MIADDTGATGNSTNILSELKLHNTLNIPIHFNGESSVYLRRPPSATASSTRAIAGEVVATTGDSCLDEDEEERNSDEEASMAAAGRGGGGSSVDKSRTLSLAAMGIIPPSADTAGVTTALLHQQQPNGGVDGDNQQQQFIIGGGGGPKKKQVPRVPQTNLITTHVYDVTRHHRCLPQEELARRAKLRDEKEMTDADRQRRHQLALNRAQRRQQRLTGFALNQNRYAPAPDGMNVGSRVTAELREAEADAEYGHFHRAAQASNRSRGGAGRRRGSSSPDESSNDDDASSTTQTNGIDEQTTTTPLKDPFAAQDGNTPTDVSGRQQQQVNTEGGEGMVERNGSAATRGSSLARVRFLGGQGEEENGASNGTTPQSTGLPLPFQSRNPSVTSTTSNAQQGHQYRRRSSSLTQTATPRDSVVSVTNQETVDGNRRRSSSQAVSTQQGNNATSRRPSSTTSYHPTPAPPRTLSTAAVVAANNPFPFMHVGALINRGKSRSPTGSSTAGGGSSFHQPRRPTTATSVTSGTGTFRQKHRAGSRSHRQQQLWKHVWLNYLDEDGNDVRHSAFVIPRCNNTLLTKKDVTDRILEVWGSDFSRENQSRLATQRRQKQTHPPQSSSSSSMAAASEVLVEGGGSAPSSTGVNARFANMMAHTDGSFFRLKASGQAFTDWETAATSRRQLLGNQMKNEDIVSNGSSLMFPSVANFESARSMESSNSLLSSGTASGNRIPWNNLIHDMSIVFENQEKLKQQSSSFDKSINFAAFGGISNNNNNNIAADASPPPGVVVFPSQSQSPPSRRDGSGGGVNVTNSTQVFLTALTAAASGENYEHHLLGSGGDPYQYRAHHQSSSALNIFSPTPNDAMFNHHNTNQQHHHQSPSSVPTPLPISTTNAKRALNLHHNEDNNTDDDDRNYSRHQSERSSSKWGGDDDDEDSKFNEATIVGNKKTSFATGVGFGSNGGGGGGAAESFNGMMAKKDYVRLGQVPLIKPMSVLGKSAPRSSAAVTMDQAQARRNTATSNVKSLTAQASSSTTLGGGGGDGGGIRRWEYNKALNLPEVEKDTFMDTLFSNPAEDEDWVMVADSHRGSSLSRGTSVGGGGDSRADAAAAEMAEIKSENAKLLAAIATKDQQMALHKKRLDTVGHAAFTRPPASSKETATHLIREMQLNAETNSHIAVMQQIDALEAVLERRGKKLPIKMQLRKAKMQAEYYDHLTTGKPAASEQKGSVRGAGVVSSGMASSSSWSAPSTNKASQIRAQSKISYTPKDLLAVDIGPRANPNIVNRWRLRHLNSKLEAQKSMEDLVKQRDAHRAVVTGTKGVIGSLSHKLSLAPSELQSQFHTATTTTTPPPNTPRPQSTLSSQQSSAPSSSPRNPHHHQGGGMTASSRSTSARISRQPPPTTPRPPSTGLLYSNTGRPISSLSHQQQHPHQRPLPHRPSRPMSASDFVRCQSKTAFTEAARKQPPLGAKVDNMWSLECRELATEAAGDLLRAQVRLRILSFLKRKWWTEKQQELLHALHQNTHGEKEENNKKEDDEHQKPTATSTNGVAPISTPSHQSTPTNNNNDNRFTVEDAQEVFSLNATIDGGGNIVKTTMGIVIDEIDRREEEGGRGHHPTTINQTATYNNGDYSTTNTTAAAAHVESTTAKKGKSLAEKEADAMYSAVSLEVFREFDASEFSSQEDERELFYTLLPVAVSSLEARMLLVAMFEALTVTAVDDNDKKNETTSSSSSTNHGHLAPRNQFGWRIPVTARTGMRTLEDIQLLVSEACRDWVHNAPKTELMVMSTSMFPKRTSSPQPSLPAPKSVQRRSFFSSSLSPQQGGGGEEDEEEDTIMLPCTSEGRTIVSFVVYMLIKGSLLDTHDLTNPAASED